MVRARALTLVVVALFTVAGCGHGDRDPEGQNASCAWTETGTFDDAAPHVCLTGSGPRFDLRIHHLTPRSTSRAVTVDGETVTIALDAQGDGHEEICTPGGQVVVSGEMASGDPFDVRVTAANDPNDWC